MIRLLRTLFVLYFLFFFISCNSSDSKVSISRERISVFIFLSPTCPLCQNYTLTLNELYNSYNTSWVDFLGVYPLGTDTAEIKKFESEYKPAFVCKVDSDRYLFNTFSPHVTPEVFVQNSTGDVLYSGAIDNWMYDTGKKRASITEHYLSDALNDLVNGKEIKVRSAKAYGCFIE